MEGACVPGTVLLGVGNHKGAERKRGSELTHAHWAASAPPPSGFLSNSTTLPEVQPPSRPPAATPWGRPRPHRLRPPTLRPLLRCWRRLAAQVLAVSVPQAGSAESFPERRPGYDRGSPASRSGHPESLSSLVPVPEQSPQPGPAARLSAATPARPLLPMAAEIQPKPLTRKPILLQRVEGSQEVVNMAVIVPKEEGVISVSEDRYGPPPLGREEGRDGPAVPEPGFRAVPPRRRECRRLPQVFNYNAHPDGAGVQLRSAATAWLWEAETRRRRALWPCPGRVALAVPGWLLD